MTMKFLIEEEHQYLSGIYIITNDINGKVYVGRTTNFYRRYHQYKYSFKTGKIKHINQHFLNAMNKYEFNNFSFQMITLCTLQEAIELELLYMYLFESFNKTKGYNKRLDTDGGMIVSSETSMKISTRLRKEWSEGTRSGHGEKLKKSWENRSRIDQSKIMTKNLTKYYYIIDDDHSKHLTYKELVDLGYRSVISSFYRKKSNRVIFKEVIIERFLA